MSMGGQQQLLRLGLSSPSFAAPAAHQQPYPRPLGQSAFQAPNFLGGPVPPPPGPWQGGPGFGGPPVHPPGVFGSGPAFDGGPVHPGEDHGPGWLGPPIPLAHALAMIGGKHPDLGWKQRRQMARGQAPASAAPGGSYLDGLLAAISAALSGSPAFN